MTRSSIEVFTIEYRHDVVEKFIKSIIDGYISLALPSNNNSEAEVGMMSSLYDSFKNNIVKYVSCEKTNDQNSLEGQIFSDIFLLRMYGLVVEKNNHSLEIEIQQINKKIDATNDLLSAILQHLQKGE